MEMANLPAGIKDPMIFLRLHTSIIDTQDDHQAISGKEPGMKAGKSFSQNCPSVSL